MKSLNLFYFGEIGDSSCQFEDTGEATSGKAEFVGHLFKQLIAFFIEFAETPYMPGLHLAVGMQAEVGQTVTLDFTCLRDFLN